LSLVILVSLLVVAAFAFNLLGSVLGELSFLGLQLFYLLGPPIFHDFVEVLLNGQALRFNYLKNFLFALDRSGHFGFVNALQSSLFAFFLLFRLVRFPFVLDSKHVF